MSRIPRSAGEVLTGNSPIHGTAEESNLAARFLADVGRDVAQFRVGLDRSIEALETMRGLGVDMISGVLRERARVGALSLDRTATDGKAAFERFTDEIERIHGRAWRLVAQVDGYLDDIRRESRAITEIAEEVGVVAHYDWRLGPPRDLPAPQRTGGRIGEAETAEQVWRLRELHGFSWSTSAERWAVASNGISRLADEWVGLADERLAAEHALATSLDSTAIGQIVVAAGGGATARRQSVAFAISGQLHGLSDDTVPLERSHPLLVRLIGTETGAGIWHAPPALEVVAARWAALPTGLQERLIAEVPWVIGNLAGLPIGVRDRANRRLMAHYAAHHDRLSPQSLAALRDLTAQLARKRVGAGGETERPMQVVSLDLGGEVPMAVVSIGDLDAAQHATWLVPGMLSDAHSALTDWAGLSRVMLHAQRQALESEGRGGEALAVVAFLGYDTPNLVTVLGPDAARDGARRLALELDGAAASHLHSGAQQEVGVIAHSYGTPTAANALMLTRYPVRSFTMLGSAGLDSGRVVALEDLLVARDSSGRPQIYSTMAAGDGIAPFGAGLSGRAQPNPESVLAGGSAIHGAYLFSSEGLGVLRATDGHSASGSGDRGPLGTNASSGQGYLDFGTQSQWNAAVLSIGLPEKVAGALRVALPEPPEPRTSEVLARADVRIGAGLGVAAMRGVE